MANEASPAKGAQSTSTSHERCMSCHRKDFRKIDCKSCHPDLIENPTRPVAMFSHDANFRTRHGTLARGDEAVCNHCHRQSDCADCHSRLNVQTPVSRQSERVDRDLVHRGDFVTRHAIEASADPNRCLKCHTTAQCTGCHTTRGVGAAAPNAQSPHPTTWLDSSQADNHGKAARRNIASCSTCHDQGVASNCVRCHKVGGFGGNPHPANWHPRQDKSDKMCRTCHI